MKVGLAIHPPPTSDPRQFPPSSPDGGPEERRSREGDRGDDVQDLLAESRQGYRGSSPRRPSSAAPVALAKEGPQGTEGPIRSWFMGHEPLPQGWSGLIVACPGHALPHRFIAWFFHGVSSGRSQSHLRLFARRGPISPGPDLSLQLPLFAELPPVPASVLVSYWIDETR